MSTLDGLKTLVTGAGGGIGAWVTFSLVLILILIIALSFKYGTKDVKAIDILMLIIALAAIPLWLIVDQPALSAVILTLIGVVGFIPTVRKSWKKPHTETISAYVLSAIRHVFSILALVEYNITTVFFPATWIVVFIFFSTMLVTRRKSV